MRVSPPETPMQHFEEATRIWQDFVPERGQARTVQGELLRAVEKLRDEATRNGNMNWDVGFEILLEYAQTRLTDPNVYAQEVIERTRAAFTRLRAHDRPYLEDDLYDALGDRVVEYFRHYGSLPHAINPDLHR